MSSGFSDKSSNWGDFGSYIGGTVGTFLSALNFIILLFLSLQSREEQNHEWITTIRINKYHDLLNDLKNNSNPRQYFLSKDLDDDFFLFDDDYDTLMKIQHQLRTKYTDVSKDKLLKFLKAVIKSKKDIVKEINSKYNA